MTSMTTLANIWTFTQKELKSYFNSPVAYVILTLFLLISGWFFSSGLFLIGQADMRDLFGVVVPLAFLFFVPPTSSAGGSSHMPWIRSRLRSSRIHSTATEFGRPASVSMPAPSTSISRNRTWGSS